MFHLGQKKINETSMKPINHMLSYGISNPYQPDFGPPLISQHSLWFDGLKKKKIGKLYNFDLKKCHRK